MPGNEIYLIIMIIFMAGIVQGASGFGFGLMALASLSFIMDVKEASIILALTSLSINITIFIVQRRHFKKERIMPLIISAIVGAPLGVCFLLNANHELIRKTLGVVLAITVIQRMIPHISKKRWHQYYLGIPCGLAGGALAGAFGTGGPPVVAYMASQDFDRHRYSAAVQAALGVGTISRIISLGIGNAFTETTLTISGTGIIFAMAGAFAGTIIMKKISDSALKKIISALLAVMAFKYLFF